LYFTIGNFDEAHTQLLQAQQLYPDGSAILVTLGLIDLARGELTSAEAFFRKVLDRGPDLYAQSNLGVIYYYQGKYDLAIRTWQTTLQQAPDDSANQANLADAYRATGEQTNAREHYLLAIKGYQTTIAANPQDYDSRAGLAMAMSAVGRCEEAKEEIRTVLSQQEKNPELAANAAVTAARCGDHKWAVQIVLNSISIKNFKDIRFHPDLEVIRQVPEVKRAMAQHSSN
jgi:tetratricopeptide (TPR) repeat protein